MRRTHRFVLIGILLASFAAGSAHAATTQPQRHKAGAAAGSRHGATHRKAASPARRRRSGAGVRHSAAPPCVAPPRAAGKKRSVQSDAGVSKPDTPAPRAKTRAATGRRQPVPPPLRGSRASLVRQNEKTEDEGLDRIDNDNDLELMIRHRRLVPVPTSASLAINEGLPQDRRYCRPWTASMLTDLARAHQTRFHRSIEVNSAVRTVEVQKKLERINGNAAPATGDVVSPHLTGAAVDIGKQGMTREEIGWMRSWLLPLQKAGKLDVEEEFHQACFHITVYKSYAPPRPTQPATRATGRHRSAGTGPAPAETGQPASLPAAGDTASGAE